MSNLVRITTTISGDEKAYGLLEAHEQSPDSRGFHRYQVLLVNRDGELAEFRKDMGRASNFKGVNPIAIPSLWEHTCDELMDIADELRGQVRLDLPELLQLNKEDYKLA